MINLKKIAGMTYELNSAYKFIIIHPSKKIVLMIYYSPIHKQCYHILLWYLWYISLLFALEFKLDKCRLRVRKEKNT